MIMYQSFVKTFFFVKSALNLNINPSSSQELHQNLLPHILSKLEEEGKVTRKAVEIAQTVTLAMILGHLHEGRAGAPQH